MAMAGWKPLGWLPLLLQGVGVGAASTPRVKCRHGNYSDERQACDCLEGWSTAGITDTIDWIGGTCEQYHCQSDNVCQDVLGMPWATCPIPGWNCYCGWGEAIKLGGHGFENAGGKCMGLMYTFSVWTTHKVEWAMYWLWQVVLVLAVLLLPFGRKRAICDHHWPSLWNGIRRFMLWPTDCRGECVNSQTYTLDCFKDDIAWPLYVLDMGVWSYLFLICFYVLMMFYWSFVLWLLVLVMIIAVCLGAACSCMDPSGCSDAACIGDGAGHGCGDCFGLGSCDCMGDIGFAGADTTDAMLWSGTFPQSTWLGFDPLTNYAYGRSNCDCCCFCADLCRTCLKPLAWLFYVFPAMPENAWGGICGYFIFGTHHLTPEDRLYTEDTSPVVEFLRMGWRRQHDLHGDDAWRTRVRDFLLQTEAPGVRDSFRCRQEVRLLDDDVIAIGNARAKLVYRQFDQEGDRCFPSSFEDYVMNECWICKESKGTWDLWLSCRHLFCEECSTEMLLRRMPCPLCRVSSAVVLRGHAYAAVQVDMDSDGSSHSSGSGTRHRPL